MPENGEVYAWTGDIGAACGQAWEYSHASKGKRPNGLPYHPKCTWMDTDHGRDIDVHPTAITLRQMKINVEAYSKNNAAQDLDYYCGATAFAWMNDDPIDHAPARGPGSARTLPGNATQLLPRPRNQRSADRLVVNSRPDQPASALCNSPTSRGSDFVSTLEGLFCDMETKTLYPLCGRNMTGDCFDLDLELLKHRSIGPRTPAVGKYRTVSHWD